jgi:hypothetical protein
MSLVLDKDTDPNSIDLILTGVYQFRIGVKRPGPAPPTRSPARISPSARTA